MTRIQRWLAWGSSFALFYALLETGDLSIIISGLIYLCIYNIIVYNLTRSTVKSVVQNLFILFFSIGHVFKTSIVLSNMDLYKDVGWYTVGSFDFSALMMLELFVVQAVGVLGAFLAFKWFFKSRQNRLIYAAPHVGRSFRINPYELMVAWFLFAVFLIYLVQKLGFGMHGLAVAEDSRLPFKLGGLLLYMRNVFLFGVGLALFDVLVQSGYRAKVMLFCVLYFVVALYYSLASLSRSAMAVTMFPLIYLWIKSNKAKRIFSKAFKFAWIALLLVFVAITVNQYRVRLYGGDVVLDENRPGIILETISNLDFKEFLFFSDFFVNRIEGSRELMAVISSNVSGLKSLWSTFYNSNDGEILESVMGFLPIAEGRAYGMTYGLFGLLYLSKNLLVVFFGVAFYVWFLLVIERLLLKRGYVATSFFISFVFFINVWGNMVWFFMFRFVAILLILYVFVVFVMERFFLRRSVIT